MKKLLPTAVAILLFSLFDGSATAQSSLRFLDGIEFKPEILEYNTATPIASSVKPLAAESKFKVSAAIIGTLATEACKSIQFKYAQLLDMEIEGVVNLTMYGFIEEWWSARYRYGGTTRKGIDCSALSGLLLATVYGLAVPRTAHEQYAASERVGREFLQEGDLVFFNTRGGVSHVGVYLANDRFVHASVSDGVTISNLNDPYYAKKYIGGGRVKADDIN